MSKPLRIGYVPGKTSELYYNLNASLVPFPSGTGHMIQSLRAAEIDVGVGLTEGWVAGLAKPEKGYKLVGTYVETPLCWAISTGPKRNIDGVQGLRNGKIGVSRIGSGSYVMGFVLADQNGWLKSPGEAPFDVVPLDTFAKLREGVKDGVADFFMWEHFTSKRYYDNGEIKRIGEIYTPWSSWKIVARESDDSRLDDMFKSINQGVAHFNDNKDEAVEYISTELDYSKEDAIEWLTTVKFAHDTQGVDEKVIDKTIDILAKAGVVDLASCSSSSEMISRKRAY
ncbi:periplasmic binding protein-like II [Pseudovirgaria hyperparasitica]|uniref:Periplasmic binding protein-like II n=1 Tax=Pseudovirgaria hyperparasitica TaxID=470096 RepID=A0A6A6W167_9PEZI|nr:periplasmic binding protein-like II [Pseudovirgaria hyperparasitica]KAF2754791.1 periplasmic binding protein-like II [Pseudovirgaria hyperparasitica]